MKVILKIRLMVILQAMIIGLVMNSCVFCKPNLLIEGKTVYSCKEDSLLMIVENSRLFVVKQCPQIKDTLAICNLKFVNKDFIEIDSDEGSEPYVDPLRSCNIEYDFSKDSTLLVFDIPNVKDPLSIKIISFNIPDSRTIIYTADDIENHRPVIVNYGGTISRNSNFHFVITPYNITETPFKSVYGVNNGTVKITSWDIPFIPDDEHDKRSTNHLFPKIKITIPDLTDNTFTKMFIHNEFVKVVENHLLWRDMIFEKIDKQQY